MKYIKQEYKVDKNFSENFLKRILKNGQKYKYFKYLKNIMILFSKYYYINYLNVPTFRIINSSIINEKSLIKNFHEYTFIIKSIYKKKKWRKSINVTKLNFNYSKEKEIYKLIYYILYFLKIRTFQLKLFYLIYIFNFKFFKKIKIYKKLKRYYFSQLKSQKLTYLSVFKKKFHFGLFLPSIKKFNKIKYDWDFNFYKKIQGKIKNRLNFKINNKKIFKRYFFLKKKYIKSIIPFKKRNKKKYLLIKKFNKNNFENLSLYFKLNIYV